MTNLLFFGGGLHLYLLIDACAAIRRAARSAYPLETTGPLFGIYAESVPGHCLDSAMVTEAPVAVRAATGATCETDAPAIDAMCAARWPATYFLGMWHTHPEAPPVPSEDDLAALRELAAHRNSNCPEPVMLIMGGTHDEPKWSAHAFKDGVVHELRLLQLPG